MNKPSHLEIFNDHAVSRPIGEVTIEQVVELGLSSIAFARDHQISKLIFIATGLTGFQPPSLAARYYIFREAARIAEGKVSLALVVQAEMIDHEKIGATIAGNAGLRMNIFASEEEALAWLQSLK